MRRSEFADFVKGILISLVCIGHFIQYVAYKNSDFWLDPLFKFIYMFHMPLFMAVAGFLSYRGISEAQSPTVYLKNRLVAYLLPIISWTIIYQIVITAFNNGSLSDVYSGVLREALKSLWFLWALMGAITLTLVAQRAGKYRLFVAVTLFIATLALPDRNNLSLFKYVFPFFLIGFFLAPLNLLKIEKKNLNIILIILSVSSIVCFVFWTKSSYVYVTQMTLTSENLINICFRWLAGCVVSMLALAIMHYAWRHLTLKTKFYFVCFGKESIYIYIIQNYVFAIVSSYISSGFIVSDQLLLIDCSSVLSGLLITFICWWVGCRIASNHHLAYWLFGKARRT